MMTTPFVTCHPQIMSGAPCFAGTRIPVKTMFDYFVDSSTLDDFLEDFQGVTREMAVGVLEAAYVALIAKLAV